MILILLNYQYVIIELVNDYGCGHASNIGLTYGLKHFSKGKKGGGNS